MKNIFTILTILLFNSVSSQEAHLVKVTTNTDAVIGENYTQGCNLENLEILKPNTELILYGYVNCDGIGKTEYYKVFHNGFYFINKSEVNISVEEDLYLRSINADQELILSEMILEQTRKTLDDLKKKTQPVVNKYKQMGIKNGILIKKSNVFDQSEYTDGTGYSFTPINTSKKAIKYIWVTIKGINPVNDIVGSKTLKCIGPLEPNNEAEYSFDYTWYTDTVETCKIASIKIQYMDGSIKQIVNAESLILSESLYDIMYAID